MELKNIDDFKGLYIPDMNDNNAFARDVQQQLSAVRIKVDRSIPEMINLYNYDKPEIQLMGFEKKDTWTDENNNICICAWDHMFELICENGDDLYKLNNVYKKW